MKQYEAMFLIDPTFAADVANAENEVRRILGRAGAEVIVMGKWDERKLAYPIQRRKRGCYVLAYFNAEQSRIKDLERDCHLSEHVLRVLVTRAEELSRERMEKALAEAPSAVRPARADDDEPRVESDARDTDSEPAVAVVGGYVDDGGSAAPGGADDKK